MKLSTMLLFVCPMCFVLGGLIAVEAPVAQESASSNMVIALNKYNSPIGHGFPEIHIYREDDVQRFWICDCSNRISYTILLEEPEHVVPGDVIDIRRRQTEEYR